MLQERGRNWLIKIYLGQINFSSIEWSVQRITPIQKHLNGVTRMIPTSLEVSFVDTGKSAGVERILATSMTGSNNDNWLFLSAICASSGTVDLQVLPYSSKKTVGRGRLSVHVTTVEFSSIVGFMLISEKV
ncbi:hypothetical protein PABG_03769 [Paracoccidioides brasiliensis Pb03]|nr:hypothetical protein PABG_03769 [Paracoccidioides brasiliensis Pb03]